MSRPSRPTKALEAYWYAKLAASGFDDIEDTSTDERLLISWHSFKYQQIPSVRMETTRKYFERAADLLRTHRFENDAHRLIWQLFCEGLTEREIVKQVKTYKKSMVHVIITKIARLLE